MKIVALLVRGEVDLAGASRSILGILGILAHPDMLTACAQAARALGHPDAAARLADLAEHLAEGGSG